MKKINLKDKSGAELSEQYKTLKSKLLKLNFDLAANNVKDVSQINKTKKDIARILTVLHNLK